MSIALSLFVYCCDVIKVTFARGERNKAVGLQVLSSSSFLKSCSASGGDNPILIGAGIGLVMNGINNVSNGKDFFHGGAKASIIGGVQGGLSAAIGAGAVALSANVGPVGVGLYQAGAHGLTGGLFSSLGGGNFGSGFLSGAIFSFSAKFLLRESLAPPHHNSPNAAEFFWQKPS